MSKKTCLYAVVLAAVLTAGCKKTSTRYVPVTNGTIPLLSIMKASFDYSLFLYAVQKTGQDTLFSNGKQHTVFLPDNVAFANDGITSTTDLDRMSIDSLRMLVRYHIIEGAVRFEDIPRTINSVYMSLAGKPLYVTNNGTQLRVEGDSVLSVDGAALDGYLHILNRPLKLPWPSIKVFLQADTNYSILAAGLERFGLLDQLDSPGGSPLTMLAPTNAAFLGEGIGMDSINHMDSMHFKPLFFTAGWIPATRIFIADLDDGVFAPGGGGYAYPSSYFTYIQPTYILMVEDRYSYPSYSLYYWNVMDPIASQVNLNSVNGQPVYLGPNWWWGMGIYGLGAQLVEPDHVCANGIVHGLDDILVYPDSVRKQ